VNEETADGAQNIMELIAITVTVGLSVGLGVAATRTIFEVIFSVLMPVRQEAGSPASNLR
jgi:hypothetical protein